MLTIQDIKAGKLKFEKFELKSCLAPFEKY